jgi:hypothetical protein
VKKYALKVVPGAGVQLELPWPTTEQSGLKKQKPKMTRWRARPGFMRISSHA